MAATRDKRLHVRLSVDQEELIRSAAEAEGKTLTDFALESMTTRASHVLAERRIFWLTPEAWEQLNAALDTPPASRPRLEALLKDEDFFQ